MDRSEPQLITDTFTDVEAAAAVLRTGGIVAFPTETVYGLGARCDDENAIAKIYQAKGRPSDNPLIVHCASVQEVARVCRQVTDTAKVLLHHFAPGPLTVVLHRQPWVSDRVTGGLDTVAVRIPAHAQARKLIQATGTPLVAPSANQSGKPSPTTWQAVWEDLHGRIDGVLMGEPTQFGVESTVVDCTVSPPCILRHGGLTYEALAEVIPDIDPGLVQGELAKRSPGTRYRHYSPTAQVVIWEIGQPFDENEQAAFLGLQAPAEIRQWPYVMEYEEVADYMRGFYEALRQVDRLGIQRVYCQRVEAIGLGKALMDRIERASAP